MKYRSYFITNYYYYQQVLYTVYLEVVGRHFYNILSPHVFAGSLFSRVTVKTNAR
jgi:hypothetical protein